MRRVVDGPYKQTSADAYALVDVESMAARVLRTVRRAGADGRTDDELIAETGIAHKSMGGARGKLVDDGTVVDSGVRRNTRGGNAAIVWMAVPPGMVIALPKRIHRPPLDVINEGTHDIIAGIASAEASKTIEWLLSMSSR